MRFATAGIALLLLAALSSVGMADAPDPAPRPAEEHLLLVPAGPAATAELARADARVVARYGSFDVVEAAGPDEARLRAAGAQRRDDMREVRTAAGAFDPAAERRSLAAKRAPDRDEALALVQFVGPPKHAWMKRLRATGAEVVTYQAENAYVVHAEGPALDRVAALVGADPAVRAVVPLTAADKVEGRAQGRAVYAVATASSGGLRIRRRSLDGAGVDARARDPRVVAIEREGTPRPLDERVSQIAAGNLGGPLLGTPSGPGYLAWHDARFPGPLDATIDVTDSGLDNGADPSDHPDFHQLGSGANPDRIAYGLDYTPDADARDCTGHGTNVASVAGGYNAGAGAANEDSAGFNHGLGVAPTATLGASKIFRCDGSAATFSPAAVASAAYAAGADISNNSWGVGGSTVFWGAYSSRARAYDQLVRDAQSGTAGNQQLVEVFAAGNDGTVGQGTIHSEATAKNVITVGASESVRASGVDGCATPDASADNARQVASFSSRGPTDDGRLKPDLVAPGTHVTGAHPLSQYTGTGTCTPSFAGTYSLVSGTSQAAPVVSGAAALTRDWYERTVPGGAAPSPAMTKALLANTATDLGGGPNAEQGWGRVNVGSVVDSTARELYDQLPADVLTNAGETVVRSFAVQSTARPVKVTLAWTDAPGPLTGNAFVNNLDLEVAAGGATYRGNAFAGAFSRRGGAADARNNLESVYLPAGTSGRFAVTVRATALGGDGLPGSGDASDQDFALAVSNADEQPAPVLVHQATTVVDAGPGGDGDGALESDERVQLSEQVRNAGDADATGVSATLSAGGGLSITQAGSAYPAIAAGDGLGSNTTGFAGHLANAAACGADVPATLAIASASGTQTVPIVLPTGRPGALQVNSAASPQVPIVIPDDDVGGVSSMVFVPDRGRIKDLNVTIPGTAASPGVDHPAVGDLVIDLTGPDGTTVRLADHPGGPDNDGDDMAGTTFDDEAALSVGQGTAPYTGSFRPQSDQLSRFDGKSRRGTWTLRVRDLFAGDVGTLRGWGVASQKAACDIDTTPPETTVASGPGGTTTATAAAFRFASPDAGATFECRLDGASYEPCAASRAFGGLALGTHTVNARAIDGSDNEDSTPAAYTWRVVGVAPVPAASFVAAPAEADLDDLTAGRFGAVAACAAACRASARIGVSAATARRLGLGRRVATLGSAVVRRGAAGTAKLTVRVGRRTRAALRGRARVGATVTVTVREGAGAPLTVRRKVTLLRSMGPARIARSGLRYTVACARRCSLGGSVTIASRSARRLGLRPGAVGRYRLASAAVSVARTPKLLKLGVRRAARGPLRLARKVSVLVELTAGRAPEPIRTARLSRTLRR